MRYMVLGFCEQTHPHCRGYACDDHIDEKCYTVLADAAFLAVAEPLLADIEHLAQVNLEATCAEWYANNPGQDECPLEGDEFVGLRWVTHSTYDGADDCSWLSSSTEVLKLLAELCCDLGGAVADVPIIV